jgi:N-methylhydantoinase B
LRGPEIMSRTMTDNHTALRRGDAFLHNSPYHGCTHPADHSILVPVIDDDGVHRFTVLAKGHQADCGNALPTTYMGAAKDVYAEGALIFPAVKIQSDYQHQMDIVRLCQMRIRVPGQWWGDYLATLGAARVGEREVLALGREIGWDVLDVYVRQWFDYSESRMDAAIRAMPARRLTRSSRHDPFPGTPPDGVEIKITVEIDPEAGMIDIDATDNPDCFENGLNLSEACARSAPMVGVFNSIDASVPKNEGSFRRIRVKLREGCAVGVPRHPTSCSVATTNLADRVANPVQNALAELVDGLGLAEAGACIPASSGVISGTHNGKPFVNEVYLGCTGGAGAPQADGWLTIMHVGNAGMCYQDSIEVDELRHPILVHSRRLMPDTEGAGRFRGALSAYSEFSPLGCEMTVAYVSDGGANPAKGVRGGLAGGPSSQFRKHRNGLLEPTPGCAEVRIEPGEAMVSISCGGGGYGSPAAREPWRVADDVREGWISAARARSVYQVALTEQLDVDEAETARLRGDVSPTT